MLTLAVFLPGYQFGEGNTCLIQTDCKPSALFHHPGAALGFFLGLIGNVVPGGAPSPETTPIHDAARVVGVGIALLAIAVFIIVQSVRHRASGGRMPLPLLLIVFSLLFDVAVTVGRGGTGPSGAVDGNRFVMANLILLTGIVIYAVARVPGVGQRVIGAQRHESVKWLALLIFGIFLVVQVVVATGFGVTNARANRGMYFNEARLLDINPRLIVHKSTYCRLAVYALQPYYMGASFSILKEAKEDHMGEFRPGEYAYYRTVGPGPDLPTQCS